MMDDILQASWTTESFGCAYDTDAPHSPEDRRADSIAITVITVCHNGSRWVAPILVRDTEAVFPASRSMAEKRAKDLE